MVDDRSLDEVRAATSRHGRVQDLVSSWSDILLLLFVLQQGYYGAHTEAARRQATDDFHWRDDRKTALKCCLRGRPCRNGVLWVVQRISAHQASKSTPKTLQRHHLKKYDCARFWNTRGLFLLIWARSNHLCCIWQNDFLQGKRRGQNCRLCRLRRIYKIYLHKSKQRGQSRAERIVCHQLAWEQDTFIHACQGWFHGKQSSAIQRGFPNDYSISKKQPHRKRHKTKE